MTHRNPAANHQDEIAAKFRPSCNHGEHAHAGTVRPIAAVPAALAGLTPGHCTFLSYLHDQVSQSPARKCFGSQGIDFGTEEVCRRGARGSRSRVVGNGPLRLTEIAYQPPAFAHRDCHADGQPPFIPALFPCWAPGCALEWLICAPRATLAHDGSRAPIRQGEQQACGGRFREPLTLCDSDRVIFVAVSSGLFRWKSPATQPGSLQRSGGLFCQPGQHLAHPRRCAGDRGGVGALRS